MALDMRLNAHVKLSPSPPPPILARHRVPCCCLPRQR